MTTIQNNSVATIHYQLTLDDGTIADSSFGGEPMAYLHGHGNLVPGLERQLSGKSGGDKFEVEVPCEEAYGQLDPDADQVVPRDAFPAEAELTLGMGFHGEDEKGKTIPLFVKGIEADKVTITSNHPLAGQRLTFKIEVVSVREALAEELSHGHVHGPGGHHH